MFVVIATDKHGNQGIYGPFHSLKSAKEYRDKQRLNNPGFDLKIATLFRAE